MAESTYTAPATYTITFPSLSQSEVKVSINGVLQSSGFTISGYATSGSGTVSFTSAPASGAHVRIFRDTTILSNQAPAPKADFQAGATIQSADLNNNMDQVLYKLAEKVDSGDISADSVVTQAIRDLNVTTAKIANNAVTSAKIDSNILTSHATQVTDAANSAATATAAATTATNQATAAATQATAAANSAAAAATEAGSIAGSVATAQAAATAAQTQATASAASAATATTNATAALNNSREDDGSGGFTSAISIANTAKNTADAATTVSTTADSNATTALNNSRESDGSGGFTSAIAKATTAVNTANSASAAVANAVFYTLIANFAAFPSSPSNQDRIEVADSTGLESQSIIAGLPSGFTGSNDLTVRLEYNSSTSKWDFKQYFAADPESRYIPKSGGTFTGNVGFDNDVVVRGTTSGTSGELTFNCGTNSHGVKIKGPPHSAGATYTITLPTTVGASSNFLITDGAGNLSWRGSDYLSGGNSVINTSNAGISLSAVNNGTILNLTGTGASITTPLTLSGNPTAANHAVNKSYVDTEVAGIVSSAPATLDTLNELAAALGDDPNFATTTANSIGTKLPLAGGTLTGNVDFNDNVRARFGTGDDLQIYHDDTNSFIVNQTGSLFIDNTLDDADIYIRSDNGSGGTATYLHASGGDGQLRLYHYGNLKFNTKSYGIDVTGSIVATGDIKAQTDAGKLMVGAGDDLQIYHDGTDTFIDNDEGDMLIRNTGDDIIIRAADDVLIQTEGSEGAIIARGDGTVELYYNNSKKFETTTSGVTVTGTVSDSIGPLRRLGIQNKTANYTLVSGDAGKLIRITTGAITVPASVFTAGDMVSIFNVGSGNVTVSSSAVTVYNSADADTGNTRTIAAKGMVTLVCTATNEFVISGSQLT